MCSEEKRLSVMYRVRQQEATSLGNTKNKECDMPEGRVRRQGCPGPC